MLARWKLGTTLLLCTLWLLLLPAQRLWAGPNQGQTKDSSPASAARGVGKDVWLAPAFTADPAQLVSAADAVKPGVDDSVLVLFEGGHYRLAPDGRATLTFRRIYKVLRESGVDEWGHSQASWAPWYQAQPQIRARVISPDGTVHPLDPKTIEIGPAGKGDDHTYSDYRQLRAPLPRIRVGAIVEEEILLRDTQPFFAEGDTRSFYFGSVAGQTLHVELVLDAPTSLPMHVTSQLLKGLRTHTVRRQGRVVQTFSVENLPRIEDIEDALPPDVPRRAEIEFSTGKSWNEVARGYAKIVEQRISEEDIDPAVVVAPTPRDRAQTIASVLAQIQGNVRYTGLELGRASIVPWSPAETWRRRYGDCKDKATLLVAMLRHAGISAHVALLRSGHGEDIEPSLPGLGGFNHAIVVVPPLGKPRRGADAAEVWIDPTDEFARPAELPRSDQGRYALIAAASTQKLVRTPVAPAAANRLIEEREVYLAESGYARVVETSRMSGSYERYYRHQYRSLSPKELRTELEKYVKSEYLSETLTSYQFSPLSDLTRPFELTLDVADAQRGESTDEQASVWVFPKDLLAELPGAITKDDDQRKPRQQALALTPLVRELRYRIHAPDGFEVGELPEDSRYPIGPALLTASYRQEGTVLHALLRIDLGKHRYSPQDVLAARAAAKELAKLKGVELTFAQRGAALLAAGKVPEALAELNRLAALHPHEASHHRQLSSALLRVGLRDLALAQARRAVELEPKSALAHAALAWVLARDPLGREYGAGFDLRGVVESYRTAAQLDPKHDRLRANLAISLERDARGVRYRGDLPAAIAEYRALRKTSDDTTWDVTFELVLLHAGELDELLTLARSLPVTTSSVAFRVTAVAALRGVEAARQELRRAALSSADQSAALLTASEYLAGTRRYALAAELLEGAHADAANPTEIRERQQFLKQMRRFDDAKRVIAGPARAVENLFRAVLWDRPTRKQQIGETLSKNGRLVDDLDAEDEAALGNLAAELRKNDLGPENALDMIASFVEYDIDEAKSLGWRVRVHAPPPMQELEQTLFVVAEGGTPRILGTSLNRAGVGLEALDLLGKNNLDGARQWLAWALEPVGSIPLGATPLDVSVTTLWNQVGTGGRLELERTAAALLVTSRQAKRAVPVLSKCAGGTGPVAEACGMLLARAHHTNKDWAESLAVVERIRALYPNHMALRAIHVELLLRLKRAGQARAILRPELERDPNDDWTRRLLAATFEAEGNTAAAVDEYAKLAQRKPPTAGDLNGFAWYSLAIGKTGDEVLAAAKLAVTASQRKNASVLNTLAAIHAVRGEFVLAYDTMIEAVKVRGAVKPRAEDLLVHGRIAQGLGFAEQARQLFSTAIREGGADPELSSTVAIAATWRSALPARPRRGRVLKP